jgi:nitrous oxide reductase accessory protein NosL
MRASRTFLPILAASLLMAGCTGQCPTSAEPGFNKSTQPVPAGEPSLSGNPQPSSASDTTSTTSRGIGTIGSNG